MTKSEETRALARTEAEVLELLEAKHRPVAGLMLSAFSDKICACGRVWLARRPGVDETGCRQAFTLRKALRAAQRGVQDSDGSVTEKN